MAELTAEKRVSSINRVESTVICRLRTGRSRDTYLVGERKGGEERASERARERETFTHRESGRERAPSIILTVKVYSS